MTLLLNNDEIQSLVDMKECIQAMEQMYKEVGENAALSRQRSDMYTHHDIGDSYYVFKTMDGLLPSQGMASVRLNSDIIKWREYAGATRKDKLPLADGKYVGLILLFSTATGEPLAIMPDGVIQRTRVAVANAIAAKWLARKNAAVYGLIGAGWQAGSQLLALAATREFEDVRVYSPNPNSRRKFVAEHRDLLDSPLRAVESADEAVRGADIVGAATNAIRPVIDPTWVEPGMHLTCIKRTEFGEAVLAHCDPVIIHDRHGAPENYIVGRSAQKVVRHDPIDEQEGDEPPMTEPELPMLLNGTIDGRKSAGEINAFVNNIGSGVQFASIGGLIYKKAERNGIGRELPTGWFTQAEHP